jgi:hypothetical protein
MVMGCRKVCKEGPCLCSPVSSGLRVGVEMEKRVVNSKWAPLQHMGGENGFRSSSRGLKMELVVHYGGESALR